MAISVARKQIQLRYRSAHRAEIAARARDARAREKSAVEAGDIRALVRRARRLRSMRDWQAANRGVTRAASKAWKERNPKYVSDRPRATSLIRNYGITVAKYDALLAGQAGGCAICARRPGAKRLHVDHDHSTGAIRGLLCSGCNTAIGLFGDDCARLTRAIHYLRKSRDGYLG